MLAHKDGDHVRLISRQGKDFTRRFPELVAAIKADAVNTYQQGQGFVGIEKLPVRSSNSAALHMSAMRRRSAMRSSGRITAPSSAS